MQAILDEILPSKSDNLSVPSGRQPETPVPPQSNVTELAGTWSGRVHTHSGQLPLMIRVKEPGDIHARLGAQLETLLSEAKFEGGTLTGVIQGDIGTPDANRRPYQLHLDLRLREGSLC